jgi:hypothetical protein
MADEDIATKVEEVAEETKADGEDEEITDLSNR